MASAASTSATDSSTVPVVGAREPCPCGSGRRYKACHGKRAAHAAQELVVRPYAGLPGECDWVAMRELVPAATAELRLADGAAVPDGAAGTAVTLATVLPGAWPAQRRTDGSMWLGLQTQTGTGDPSRDLAGALLSALDAEPGTAVPPVRAAADTPRMQDLLDAASPFEVHMHTGFDFWVEEGAADQAEVSAALEQANAAILPTERLTSVSAAYWTRTPDRDHLRWVLPHEEETLLDALARLHAAGHASLGEGTRFVGSFRAHGLVVPVWDLPAGSSAEAMEEPIAEFSDRLDEALAERGPLTTEQRRSRNGLLNRQLTLH